MTARDIICILIAYLLGGICTGYYLVRIKVHKDIREQGSGGVGARNVGRILGRSGFIITLLGDAFKGALALAFAREFNVSALAISWVFVAVIAGHVWPLPLQFRGGRGIATALGAYLVYDLSLILLLLGITLVMRVFRRGFIEGGLVAFLLVPLVAYILERPGHTVAAVTGASVVVLFAHREHLREIWNEARPQREA